MSKRLFADAELEQLATPLSIQLEKATSRQDWEDMRRIQVLMD